MATLYIPDRKIPMLPTVVSHDKGSLEAGKRRAALSLLADMPRRTARYYATRSSHRSSSATLPCLTMKPMRQSRTLTKPYHDLLANLHMLTEALQQQREAAGAVNIDRSEMLIKVVSSNDVQVKVVGARLARAPDGRRVHGDVQLAAGVILPRQRNPRSIPLTDRPRPQRSRLQSAPRSGAGCGDRRWPPAPVSDDASLRPRRHTHCARCARRSGRVGVHSGNIATAPLP